MRIDPDTSIHDLTDAEAADLRALCEAMLRGDVAKPVKHPLLVAWRCAVPYPTPSAEFLPRALHALLRRADRPAIVAWRDHTNLRGWAVCVADADGLASDDTIVDNLTEAEAKRIVARLG